jgi:hypothetical protein
MSGAPDPAQTQAQADLEREYNSLLQFIHLAPVGLVQARHSGLITMMNPMAAQLLAHIGFGDGDGDLNLFEILDKASTDIRTLVQTFTRTTGVLCDNFRILVPEVEGAVDAPIALGITVLQLQADADGLMVVITDETTAVKLQRLQASWIS